MLERIERFNPELNVYITVTAEPARQQARKAEAELSVPRGRRSGRDRGPLHGIPISLKDNIYTAGIRTTAGSEILREFVPENDAPIVVRLRQAGAVLLGKCNMHEFAYGVTTNNPHYGAAHNPWDTSRIAGGSSGGSAVAVSAGLCFGSIGSDTGGSIRIPAALCGVVGLKPTLHRVEVTGVIPLSPSLDCVGPLGRTTGDTAILFRALVRGEGGHGAAGRLRKGEKKLSNLRLGLPREFFFEMVSPEVKKVFELALKCLKRSGAKIKGVSIPLLRQTEGAGNQIAWAEATHYHQQSGWFPERAAEYGDDVRSRLVAGTKVSATEYLEAIDQQKRFTSQLAQVMKTEDIDALVVPSTTLAAPPINEETSRVGGKDHPTRALLLVLTRPANLAGVPAISVPSGFTPGGLPVGLQLIGAPNSEEQLLHIADVYERSVGLSKTPGL